MNPFGHDAVLGFDQRAESINEEDEEAVDADAEGEGEVEEQQEEAQIFAPQGRVPLSVNGLSGPSAAAMEKPDFIRGFGLDITEEEEGEVEEEEEIVEQEVEPEIQVADVERELERRVLPEIIQEVDEDMYEDGDENKENEEPEMEDDLLTAQQSRHHSRHASRLSAALSFRSFGGLIDEGLKERGDQGLRERIESEEMAEWTGTEDVYPADSSDDEVCYDYGSFPFFWGWSSDEGTFLRFTEHW
jgi:hypothetical protein